MNTTVGQQFLDLLSKAGREREIELKFAHRLMTVAGLVSDPADVHGLAVSGKFNVIFPALADEGPVEAEGFDSLKPFDYADWAKRTGVQEPGKSDLAKPAPLLGHEQTQANISPRQADRA